LLSLAHSSWSTHKNASNLRAEREPMMHDKMKKKEEKKTSYDGKSFSLKKFLFYTQRVSEWVSEKKKEILIKQVCRQNEEKSFVLFCNDWECTLKHVSVLWTLSELKTIQWNEMKWAFVTFFYFFLLLFLQSALTRKWLRLKGLFSLIL
jgi:hypothetical protein